MKKAVFLFLLFVLVVGCSRQTMIRNYYVLNPPPHEPGPELRRADPIKVSVDVRNFTVSDAFDDTRIVARAASHEIRYYFYHHWAIRPSGAVADMLFEQLEELQLFQKLTRGYAASTGYVLTGKIFAIERLIGEENDACHLHVVLELLDQRTGIAVVRHEFDRKAQLSDKSMNTYAVQMSRLLMQEAHVFFQELITFFDMKSQQTRSS